jgi:hypothetical protein
VPLPASATHREVAAKCVSLRKMSLERIEREVAITKKVAQEHVIAVYGAARRCVGDAAFLRHHRPGTHTPRAKAASRATQRERLAGLLHLANSHAYSQSPATATKYPCERVRPRTVARCRLVR